MLLGGSQREARRWWVQTPLVTFLLLLFLIFNARMQPHGRGGGWTFVGSFLAPGSRYDYERFPAFAENLFPIAWIVRTEQGLRLAPFSEDLVASECAGIASVRFRRDRSGLWSVTHDHASGEFDLGSRENEFTAAEREHLRTLAAAYLRTEEGGVLAWMAPWFERGDLVQRRFVWQGWLNNAAVVVAVVMLVVSMAWVPGYVERYLAWRAEVERWRQWKWTDRFKVECWKCGYDTRGLPGKVCPECGERVDVVPERPGIRRA